LKTKSKNELVNTIINLLLEKAALVEEKLGKKE
jgi:hypothetical protein